MIGVRLADAVQELGPDDAAAAPDRRHRPEVDVPVVLIAARDDVVEALGVRDDLRGVQSVADVLDELVAVLDELAEIGVAGPAVVGTLRRQSLVDVPGQRPGEGGLGDAGDRNAEVKRALHGPPTGALLLGAVGDDVDERFAGLRVGVGEHVGGDLNEERIQITGVPATEDVGDLARSRVESGAQQVVRLRDELHVGVLDAVVDHLHEMPGRVRTDMGRARHAIDLRGNRFEDRAELLVRLGRAAGHDARTVQSALLAAGHSRTDEVQPLARPAPSRVAAYR